MSNTVYVNKVIKRYKQKKEKLTHNMLFLQHTPF